MSDAPLGRALVDLTGLGWRLARSRLEGLSDEELIWEPVDGCWSVRPKSEVVGVAPDESPGAWWIDGDEIEAPEPPPFTTIAWLIAHMVLATWNYNDIIAGHSVAPEPALASGAQGAVAQWEEVISRFETMVADFTDVDLATEVAAWGGQVARSFVIQHLVTEVLHHAAEVGRLRDLYRNRQSWVVG